MAVSNFVDGIWTEARDANRKRTCYSRGGIVGDSCAPLAPRPARSFRPELQIVGLGLTRFKGVSETDLKLCVFAGDGSDRRGRRLAGVIAGCALADLRPFSRRPAATTRRVPVAVSNFVCCFRTEAGDAQTNGRCSCPGFVVGDSRAPFVPRPARSLPPDLQVVGLGLTRFKGVFEPDLKLCVVIADGAHRRGGRFRSIGHGDRGRSRGRLSVGASHSDAVGRRLRRRHTPRARCRDRADSRRDRRAFRVG